MIDTSNNLSQLQAQSLQTRATATSAGNARKHFETERIASKASARSPGPAQSQEPETERANQNIAPTLPPIVEPQQAVEAAQHARALIQAQARAALLAQANASSQSVQRLLS